jgi:hypothetical protein
MTRPLRHRVLLAGALGAVFLCGRAVALDVGGSLGAGYDRSDTWAGGLHTSIPSWDFASQLSLSDSPLAPGLLTWSATGDYRRHRSLYTDSTSTTDNFGFLGSASLFQSSPLSLQLAGSRAWTEFTSSGPTEQTGSTLVTTYGARARYATMARPSFTAAVARTEIENRSFGVRSQAENTTLSTGVSQQLEGFDYALAYDTSFSSGTFADTNYRSHTFNLQATTYLTPGVELRLVDRYFLRDPTVTAGTNPRFDDNDFHLSATSRGDTRLISRADYEYRHFVTTVPGADGRDAFDHLATAATEYRYSPEWTFAGNAGASYAKDRLGATELAGSTEQVGANARWQRALERSQLFLSGGGSLGLQQRDGAGQQGAWGVSAGGGGSTARETWVGSLSYTLGLSRNLSGLFGTTLSQQLNATADTRLAGWLVRNLLAISAARRYADVGDSSVNRSIQGTVTASQGGYVLQLLAGLSDGASGTISNPGDGLFLPSTFNTRSRFAQANASGQLSRDVSVSVNARYQQSTAPGRSLQWEQGVGGVLGYSLGLFQLSLDERYSYGGYGDTRQRGNLLFVRLTRFFGARF